MSTIKKAIAFKDEVANDINYDSEKSEMQLKSGDKIISTTTIEQKSYDIATQSKNGLMSSDDKTKLDGVDTRDTKNNVVTFTSSDTTNVTALTNMDLIKSGEKQSSLWNKVSILFKNFRYLCKLIGTADISTLGTGTDIGTITGAISKLNSDKLSKESIAKYTDIGWKDITGGKWNYFSLNSKLSNYHTIYVICIDSNLSILGTLNIPIEILKTRNSQISICNIPIDKDTIAMVHYKDDNSIGVYSNKNIRFSIHVL